jgi:hypothetical protein
MEPLHEALRLIKWQTELGNALRRPGGIRLTEERELFQLVMHSHIIRRR